MKRVSVVQVGLGTVGGVLLEQILDQHDRWMQEHGLDIQVMAVANRAGAVVGPCDDGGAPQPLSTERVHALVEGRRSRITVDAPTSSLQDAIARIVPAGPVIVVDAASGEQTVDALVVALDAGAGAVLSNKAPLALPIADPRSTTLWNAVRTDALRYEATCGAGL
ncbi:MAG: hypothetical protein WBA46_01005, partial [Thermomicrobiales bacterium]